MFFDNSIQVAVHAEADQSISPSCEEKEVASLLLPYLLRNVLRLDRYPRLCFVLEVNTFTVTAMCELATPLGVEQLNDGRAAAQY